MQALLEECRVDGGVSGDEGEHGSHVWVDHPGPLGNTPDGGPSPAARVEGDGYLLGVGVGREDRTGH